MLYILIGAVCLIVGLIGNRYFAGAGYGLVGDLGFALVGGAGMAALFRMTEISAVTGMYGALVFAAIGATGLLLVRRSFNAI